MNPMMRYDLELELSTAERELNEIEKEKTDVEAHLKRLEVRAGRRILQIRNLKKQLGEKE